MSGPVPLDVWMCEYAEKNVEAETEDIGVFGRVAKSCIYDGWGHFARECPSERIKARGMGKN